MKSLITAICLLPSLAFAEDVSITYKRIDASEVGGRLIQAGKYVEARPILEDCAEEKNAECQYLLGMIYAESWGVKEDMGKAIPLIQTAANQGSANALRAMGDIHNNGLGVTTNKNLAVEFWEKAANRCEVWSQNAVARYYFEGTGVTKDLKKAYFWVSLAANYGHENAEAGAAHIKDQLSLAEIRQAQALIDEFSVKSGCGISVPLILRL